MNEADMKPQKETYLLVEPELVVLPPLPALVLPLVPPLPSDLETHGI